LETVAEKEKAVPDVALAESTVVSLNDTLPNLNTSEQLISLVSAAVVCASAVSANNALANTIFPTKKMANKARKLIDKPKNIFFAILKIIIYYNPFLYFTTFLKTMATSFSTE